MGNNDKKVSVIIPIYNAEKHLRECLMSLESQTLDEIEIIMVNDGSTDSSKSICEEFSSRDDRFILINQENGGSASARRKGMLYATGEYIGFVDSDDWSETSMFKKMYETAKQYDVDIVFCNFWRDDGKKSIKCNKYIRNGYYNREQIEDEILSRTLAGLDKKGRNHVIRWANYLRLYRRELIEKHKIYNDPRFRRCQDLQLTFEATLHAQSYYYLGDEYLYHNRVVKGSQSRGYTKELWYKLKILIEKLYEDVEAFKELNLKEQMDLCAFFFAVSACANEMKKCKGISKKDHYGNLQAICHDQICDLFLQSIPVEKLNEVNKLYYQGLRYKNADLLIKANRIEVAQGRRKKMIERIMTFPGIKKVYMKCRYKE